MIYGNTDQYEGSWKNDLRSGKGRMTWASEQPYGGWRYEGEWREDLPDGHGNLIIDLEGSRYEGCWVGGTRNGLGIETITGMQHNYPAPWLSTITILNDTTSLKTILITQLSGNTYRGEFRQNERSGSGKYTTTDGTTYIGQFQSGVLSDLNATIIYTNGDVFKGEVGEGVPCGEGVTDFANKDVYEGEYKNGSRWGSGVMTYANNDIYEGMWVNDIITGHGSMTYCSGGTYEGSFRNNQKHGRGTWTEEGLKYSVVFKENQLIEKTKSS